MYRALLDTCVLVPDLQRDFLLQLAAEWAYAPLWGTGVLFELDYVLERLSIKRGGDGNPTGRARLLNEMRQAFPGSTIEAPKDRSYPYVLADMDDGHVAHAAIIGKADALVTDDKRAGLETSTDLKDASVEVLRPHAFAANTVSAHPEAGHRALLEIAERRKNPALTPRETLEVLRDRFGMDEVHDLLDQHLPAR